MAAAMPLLCLLVASPAAAAAPAPVWASHPARPNETLVLQAYGASPSTGVALQQWSEAKKAWGKPLPTIHSIGHSDSGVSVVLPSVLADGAQHTVFRATLTGGDDEAAQQAGAEAITVNAPEVWWALGDAGETATSAKGWVRLFGRSIHLPALTGGATLQLTHNTSAKATQIKMDPTFKHNGAYSARFRVPSGLAPGTYHIAASNALAPSFFAPMQPWFDTPERPAAPGTIEITAPPRSLWPQKVFTVSNVQAPDRPAPKDSTPALHAAIAQARAAGGGVVYMPPGVYTVTGGIVLPANTVLKGAGVDKTWLTLTAQNMTTAPADGYFTSNMTGGWGVEDLTVYTSSAGYYCERLSSFAQACASVAAQEASRGADSIFNLQNIHDGVSIRRVVLRANPFHSQESFCMSGRAHPPEVCSEYTKALPLSSLSDVKPTH